MGDWDLIGASIDNQGNTGQNASVIDSIRDYYGTFIVKYGTIQYFKGRVATLLTDIQSLGLTMNKISIINSVSSGRRLSTELLSSIF